MADEELVTVLRDVAAAQQKLADAIGARAPGKDAWDKFAAISTFLSSVIIAAVAAWFTHQYDKQQLNVNELTILEKFIPHLASNNSEEQKVAIVEISALGDTTVAVQLAKLYPNSGTIAGVQEIAKNGDPAQQAIARSAIDALGEVPPQAVNIAKKFEGYTAHAPTTSDLGPPVIGYGTEIYPNGKAVQPGDSISEADATADLAYSLKAVSAGLSAIPHWSEMDANQQSALIDFAFNMGTGFYGNPDFSTITAVLRGKRWKDVPAALAVYDMQGLPGVVQRRRAEGDLWQGKGEFASKSAPSPKPRAALSISP
jgi:GH24 family phage-related lysozyme (muramidase)